MRRFCIAPANQPPANEPRGRMHTGRLDDPRAQPDTPAQQDHADGLGHHGP
jgi:hypothetical protein